MLKTAAVLAAVLLSCGACTKFEHPLVAETGPALDEGLIGRWSGTLDRDQVELTVTRQDGAGHVVTKVSENGQPPQTDEGRLITARIERQDFASIRGGEPGQESWTLVRYELHPPDRLTIYMDSGKFWERAINDKVVSGKFSTGQIRTATVTASSEELREVVQGYGSVIFEDTPLLELTRN